MGQRDDNTTLKDLGDMLYKFSLTRGWEAGYNPSFLAKSIVIEAAELLEHFQKHDGDAATRKMQDPMAKEAVSWEIVDVLYYLLMLARTLDIDLVDASKEKLVELATRYPALREKPEKK